MFVQECGDRCVHGARLVGLAGMGGADELGLRVLHKHGYTRAVILSTMPLRARLVKIVYGPYRGKNKYTHTYRQTDRKTDRKTDRQKDRQTERQTDIHTHVNVILCTYNIPCSFPKDGNEHPSRRTLPATPWMLWQSCRSRRSP